LACGVNKFPHGGGPFNKSLISLRVASLLGLAESNAFNNSGKLS